MAVRKYKRWNSSILQSQSNLDAKNQLSTLKLGIQHGLRTKQNMKVGVFLQCSDFWGVNDMSNTQIPGFEVEGRLVHER